MLKKYGHHGSNLTLAFEAYKKGLPMLELTESEFVEYENYLNKLIGIQEEFRNVTNHSICFNQFVYLHYCFPDKNIIPNYYYQKSTLKRNIAEDSFKIINELIK